MQASFCCPPIDKSDWIVQYFSIESATLLLRALDRTPPSAPPDQVTGTWHYRPQQVSKPGELADLIQIKIAQVIVM